MSPREHHYLFAHHLLHKQVFESPEQVFSELAAPMRDAFLMFLWESVGEVVDQQVKVADVGTIGGTGTPAVHKLAVMGVDDRGGWNLILLSMPPTEAAGEAIYVGLARRGTAVRYFLCEHSLTPGQPTFAEKRADGSRINMGHLDGVAPDTFLAAIGGELGFGTDDADVGSTGPRPAPAPARKGSAWKKGCLGCGALIALMGLLFVAAIGYIVYLEEGRSLHDPDNEIASYPVTPDSPLMVQVDWPGPGYAFHDFWLEVDDVTPFTASAEFACTGREPNTKELSDTDYGVVHQDGKMYIRLHDEYMRGRALPLQCGGMIHPEIGELAGARLVVSRTQRPSDFFAN